MKVTRSISLAASGDNGLGLTHPLDCNAWLIDSGEGLILVDAGVNLDNLRIEEEIAADGYRLSDIRYLVATSRAPVLRRKWGTPAAWSACACVTTR